MIVNSVTEVNQVNQLIEALRAIMKNPWMLAFLALFLFGWILKEHTSLPNKLIPWFLTAAGILLGLILLEKSLAGAIIGWAIAYIVMALYEKIKNTIEYIIQRNFYKRKDDKTNK